MIIITGASRNIGKYLFEKYFELESVIGTYFSTANFDCKYNAHMYPVDISNYESVSNFFNLANQNISKLTLINCAGISYTSFTHKSDPNEWAKVINTNLIGTYHLIRAFLPLMRNQKFGRIINFSSVVAQKSTKGVSAYAASKSGLWGMTKSIAVENGAFNISINNINLGYVNIGMGIESVPIEYQKEILDEIPSNSFCSVEQIFSTIEYMRNNAYLNGSNIDLNGGIF